MEAKLEVLSHFPSRQFWGLVGIHSGFHVAISIIKKHRLREVWWYH
jgi:hypothetical protein